MDNQPATGRCLCGAVAFQVRVRLRDVVNCHCHRCRRFTGHFMAATSSRSSDVEIDDVDGLLTWYFPVAEAGYAFCRRCGSSLFWRAQSSPEWLSICAGTLEPPTGLTTVEAWWTGEASDYHERQPVPERSAE